MSDEKLGTCRKGRKISRSDGVGSAECRSVQGKTSSPIDVNLAAGLAGCLREKVAGADCSRAHETAQSLLKEARDWHMIEDDLGIDQVSGT